jgi:hypothetical protein
MKLPELNRTVAAIDAHHESIQEPPRPHMGCSTLGHVCDRWLWLSFRWAVVEPFKGRILRLFRRGQNEEATVVADLKAIGMDVQKTGADQSRVDFGCHVSGSVDGVIMSGVPESTQPHVLEIKTHGLKSFTDLEKNGVEKSKFMHFVQMHLYMMGLKLERALYFSVCKDDDRIYTERIRLDKAVATKALERGHRLVKDARLPPPISTDPTWYECRFCAGHDFCHKSKVTQEVNCRTCAHSTARDDSTWLCERYEHTLSVDEQRTGCSAHIIHPDLVPWNYTAIEEGVVWHTPHGDVENSQVAYHSTEIVANVAACASGDNFVSEARSEMGARIVKDAS